MYMHVHMLMYSKGRVPRTGPPVRGDEPARKAKAKAKPDRSSGSFSVNVVAIADVIMVRIC